MISSGPARNSIPAPTPCLPALGLDRASQVGLKQQDRPDSLRRQRKTLFPPELFKGGEKRIAFKAQTGLLFVLPCRSLRLRSLDLKQAPRQQVDPQVESVRNRVSRDVRITHNQGQDILQSLPVIGIQNIFCNRFDFWFFPPLKNKKLTHNILYHSHLGQLVWRKPVMFVR